MKIIIVGCGKIGTAILANLVDEGHEAVAIDNDPDIITEITNIYDVIGVCGNGADGEVLEEAGIADAELFAAVTDSDELNMLACFLAKRMGASQTIARIRNPEYNDKNLSFMRHQLELSSSINPEKVAARELFNLIKLPGAMKIESFARGNYEMIELKLKAESPIVDCSLWELRKKYDQKFLVCVVQRGEEVYIPDGNFVLKAGDRIGIAASTVEGAKLFRALGIMKKQVKNVMIIGAGRTSYYLASKLLNVGANVTIIEKDHKRCKFIADHLPGATVIEGDGASQEILLEEGLRSVDSFIALTGMDEQNILVSIFAQSNKVPQVITKVNRPELASMAENLGLDTIISPCKIISDRLSGYARALENSLGSEMETLYTLMDDKAEALEFIVREDFEELDIPLKELSIKRNVLIAGIIRGRKPIIPTGDDFIHEGDHVIVLAAGKRINTLTEIFDKR
ncbi:MAG: Trk system potassium transporter TrkA [Ruminococcaceae bacterium]|nr:Trk system potassium transporter TrkA [Oscillospiraceae bacterium]